jgi:dienelactone hydrolase
VARESAGDMTQWQDRRAQTLESMQLVMGPLPDRSNLEPLDIEVIETLRTGGIERRRISYLAEQGDRVPAYLLLPEGLANPAPAMLGLHQTTAFGKGEPAGHGGKPNLHYGLELANRGYITLMPDYPGFGDNEFDPYTHGYASASMKGIWNHMRAVDLLVELPEVDSDRIGCIGHSLGGHNTLFVAAFDERLRVMVSSCGFNAFSKYVGGDLSTWSSKYYMPRVAERYGNDPALMPWDFSDVVAALAPRALFVNAPLHDDNFEVSGVRDCVAAAMPAYQAMDAEYRLVATYPDTGHDFPSSEREAAYSFIDAALRGE